MARGRGLRGAGARRGQDAPCAPIPVASASTAICQCPSSSSSSVDNPLDVDASTLFQFGSTGKTYTATAVMRLVERGEIDLDTPVRRYVPELRLKGEQRAEQVTVLQLLNHTAGWQGDSLKDTGDGDDCLVRYVEHMATLVSYNKASLSLAGHVVATITGTTFEQAVKDLLLEPLGLPRRRPPDPVAGIHGLDRRAVSAPPAAPARGSRAAPRRGSPGRCDPRPPPRPAR